MLLIASCTSHAGSSNASPTTTASAPGTTTTTTEPNQDGSLDLHTVDWHNFAVPGASCLRRKNVRLHNRRALLPDNTNGHPNFPSGTGPRYDMLELGGRVTYGDFQADGHDDAAVPLDCNNNGGTADGAILYSVAVYSGHTGTPTLLGLITPQHQPKQVLPTLLSVSAITPGTITVHEAWYGPNDMTCCPNGRATTRWALSAGGLVPAATKITADSK